MRQENDDATMRRRDGDRFKGARVGAGYIGLGGLLGAVGVLADAPFALRALIFMSEPVSSLAGDAANPWFAVALGLAVNAAALGYLVHSVTRFRSRMDGMATLAERMLSRRDG